MNNRLEQLGLFLLAGFLVVIISWPALPFANRDILCGTRNPEHPPVRDNVAGDHLQLIYHFDLAHKMMTGRIAWFHNFFEFNVDGDESTRRPGAYFLPLSGVHAFLRMALSPPLLHTT